MANVFWMKDGKILGSNGHPFYGDSSSSCCCTDITTEIYNAAVKLTTTVDTNITIYNAAVKLTVTME